MTETTTFVGIDAHKKDLFIAMLVGADSTPTTWKIPNEPSAVPPTHAVAGPWGEWPGPTFVRTGNPSDPALAAWPAFREPDRADAEFSPTGTAVKQALRRAHCDLYTANVARLR